MPELNSTTLDLLARAGGLIALGLGLLSLLLILRAFALFRTDSAKMDNLIAEYVRCRDYLMSGRRYAGVVTWRTAEGDAFREAWRNFNVQVDAIRGRYARRARAIKGLLAGVLVLYVLDVALWFAAAARRADSKLTLLSEFATALTWLLPWVAAWLAVRLHDFVMKDRTSDNSFVALWPAEGGTSEKQLAAFGKFL